MNEICFSYILLYIIQVIFFKNIFITDFRNTLLI